MLVRGVVNESALMPYLKSCSIACGGHYGNEADNDQNSQISNFSWG